RGGGVADPRVGRDLRPAARRPGPPFPEGRDPEAPLLPRPGLRERTNEPRCHVLHDAGLHIARVVPQVFEVLARIDHLEPVRHAQEEPEPWLKLADHGAKIVAAMPVENHQLTDALAVETPRQIL